MLLSLGAVTILEVMVEVPGMDELSQTLGKAADGAMPRAPWQF